jgi:hypothetical protein
MLHLIYKLLKSYNNYLILDMAEIDVHKAPQVSKEISEKEARQLGRPLLVTKLERIKRSNSI